MNTKKNNNIFSQINVFFCLLQAPHPFHFHPLNKWANRMTCATSKDSDQPDSSLGARRFVVFVMLRLALHHQAWRFGADMKQTICIPSQQRRRIPRDLWVWFWLTAAYRTLSGHLFPPVSTPGAALWSITMYKGHLCFMHHIMRKPVVFGDLQPAYAQTDLLSFIS